METTDLVFAYTVREETRDGVAAVIDGTAVPYGTEITVGQLREEFSQGAFDPVDVIGKPLAWRHDEPIGRITHARNTDTGLMVTAEIADTSHGRDAAALARMGGLGMSVGFEPKANAWSKTRDKVTRVTATLRELSLTHVPAYTTAVVGAVREEEAMPEITEVETPVVPAPDLTQYATRDDVAAVQRQIAALPTIRTTPRPQDPEQWLREYGITRFQKRALADLTVDATATDIPPVPTEVSARVSFGRPTVNAIGVSALGATGNDAVWIVENATSGMAKRTTAEKTAVASVKPTFTKITAPVDTFAGALDVSLEWAARSAAADWPFLLGQMAENYARQVNLDVAKKITAAAANTIILPATGLTTAIIGEKLAFGAAKIAQGTGRAPSLCILSAAKFFQVATISGLGFPLAGGDVGNANLSALSFQAFGLRFICDPGLDGNMALATQHGYLLDPLSVGIRENAGAPLTIEANNIELLGRDVALYGFVASAVLKAAGIVSVIDA